MGTVERSGERYPVKRTFAYDKDSDSFFATDTAFFYRGNKARQTRAALYLPFEGNDHRSLNKLAVVTGVDNISPNGRIQQFNVKRLSAADEVNNTLYRLVNPALSSLPQIEYAIVKH